MPAHPNLPHRQDEAAIRKGEPLAELLVRLASSPSGLRSDEAARRLRESGPNQPLPTRLHSRLIELLRLAFGPLSVILLVSSGASALLGQSVDAGIIAAIVLVSAALDIFQSLRSERAVKRLQAGIAPTACALRDGAFVEVPRSQIVVGDIVRLAAGDLVPADIRLCESHDLHLQQAALTGESLPAEKQAGEGPLASLGPDDPALAFLGTSVVSGTATGIVYATGARTAFGDIVSRLAARPEETEFERSTRRFGFLIVQTVFFLVLFIVIASVAMHRDALQSLLFAVALAVGLTPEFLPMITTVTLAQGAVQMAKVKVVVKHLSAIQNLGSIDVLCSDKTGTLTTGVMSLAETLDPLGHASERPLVLARLNSRFETGIKSPLDQAILASGPQAGDDYRKLDEIPFDFERRRLSVVVEAGGERLLITKGAPASVLPVCTHYEIDGKTQPLDPGLHGACDEAYRGLSARGLRVIAVAYKGAERAAGYGPADERELVLVGFLSFADPLLPGVRESLAALRRDGVDVKILTGDNEFVAAFVCNEAGLEPGRIVLGSELETMLDGALSHLVEKTRVFARLAPAQKYRVIHALKGRGHVVGFMGDGINDAPSLHGADVGISVAGAVDVAREAADIILLEPSIAVLHAGIVAGRKAFGNVMKYLLMGTSSNFGNMFSMAAATLFLPFLPMLPTQILLNNFLYDLAQITIPTDNVDPTYINAPQRWNVGLIRDFMLVIGPLSSLYDLLTFYVLLAVFHFAEPAFQTGWFVESLATQTLVLFVIRTVGRPWSNRPSVPLAVTTLAVVALGIALPYLGVAGRLGLTPLPPHYFAFLLAAVASYLVLVEIVKSKVMARMLFGTRVAG